MNYILEDNINFQEELLKALCDETPTNNNNICLITRVPLEKYNIKLSCGHTYNYDPLFKEIIKQKKGINRLETQILFPSQIKCPYCRTIQNNILPYRHGDEKHYGINWPQKWGLYSKKCISVLKSGKRKNKPCNKPCWKEHCRIHFKSVKKQSSKTYCKAILKTGKRKGEACGLRARKKIGGKWISCQHCGRHRPKAAQITHPTYSQLIPSIKPPSITLTTPLPLPIAEPTKLPPHTLAIPTNIYKYLFQKKFVNYKK